MAERTKSLNARGHALADVIQQNEVLSDHSRIRIPTFSSQLSEVGLFPLKPLGIDVLQINVGKMCNQVCKHCHVDAGPDRKEIMTREVMAQCLEAMTHPAIKTVDLTGGAPEMNPDFRWFVGEISKLGKHIIVRCNLTIILANKRFHDLPLFYKEHRINVVSSLPYFAARRTDAQRGDGVFEKSIKALRMLNEVGYGKADSGLKLDLVYNPSGAFLPGDQEALTRQFKEKLMTGFGVTFDDLFAITNLPVSRFLEYLIETDRYEDYMQELVLAFNPAAAAGVMCRNTLSVGWDGFLYDCDFNQMLDYKLGNGTAWHINSFDFNEIVKREILVNQHCFGCTAGAGSSCGGTLT